MQKRELSCFLCRELLYEYVASSIDSRRGEAVAYHLTDCSECKQEQQSLTGAIEYTRKLASIEIRQEYLKDISKPIPVRNLVAKRLGFRNWPDPLRWTVESLVFAGTVAIVVGVLGQQFMRSGSDESEIAAVEHPAETIDLAQLPDQTPNEFGEDEFTDHGNDVEISQAPPQPLEKRTATPEPDVKIIEAEQEIAANKASVQTGSENSATRSAQNGFLYRTHLRVAEIETVTNELIAKIESLGGRKAGEVPLGWRRPSGSYFHFSMPEANYQQLNEFIKKYGGPNIVKEKNPRVMPAGSIRMILEVDHINNPELQKTEQPEAISSQEPAETTAAPPETSTEQPPNEQE